MVPGSKFPSCFSSLGVLFPSYFTEDGASRVMGSSWEGFLEGVWSCLKRKGTLWQARGWRRKCHTLRTLGQLLALHPGFQVSRPLLSQLCLPPGEGSGPVLLQDQGHLQGCSDLLSSSGRAHRQPSGRVTKDSHLQPLPLRKRQRTWNTRKRRGPPGQEPDSGFLGFL